MNSPCEFPETCHDVGLTCTHSYNQANNATAEERLPLIDAENTDDQIRGNTSLTFGKKLKQLIFCSK